MHVEILVAALVLVVAVLVIADFFRRTGDGPHEHVERLAQDAGRQTFPAHRNTGPGNTGQGNTGPGNTGQAPPRPGSHGVQAAWLVRTRLSLLAVASAAAAALATAGVLRAA